MKRAKVLGIGCGGVIAVGVGVVLVGFLLPGEVRLETSRELESPPEALYPLLSTHDGLATWWAEASSGFEAQGYPALTTVGLPGPSEGVGMQFGFGSADAPFERWLVLEAEPPRRIVYEVDFGVFVVDRTLTLEPVGGGTRMVWAEEGEVGNPLARWMIAIMPEEGTLENFHGAMAALDRAAAR